MNVRRCQARDVAEVGALLDEATVWVGERGYEQWPLPYPREEIASAIDRGEVYVAELDGDVVATVTLLWDDPTYWGERPADAAYVHKLAVRRACAGRRIGHAIARERIGPLADPSLQQPARGLRENLDHVVEVFRLGPAHVEIALHRTSIASPKL